MNAEWLIKSYSYTANIVRQQASEISQAENLLQPIAGGHSFNWLLGHLVSSYTWPLYYVGEANVWPEDSRARYRDGSEPIGADGPGVLPFSELIALYELAHERLLSGLGEMTEAALRAPGGFGNNTVYESLLYFHFHEAYHVGQMTMIAELLGKNAKYVSS